MRFRVRVSCEKWHRDRRFPIWCVVHSVFHCTLGTLFPLCSPSVPVLSVHTPCTPLYSLFFPVLCILPVFLYCLSMYSTVLPVLSCPLYSPSVHVLSVTFLLVIYPSVCIFEQVRTVSSGIVARIVFRPKVICPQGSNYKEAREKAFFVS